MYRAEGRVLWREMFEANTWRSGAAASMYRTEGRDFRLTDVHDHIVHDILT